MVEKTFDSSIECATNSPRILQLTDMQIIDSTQRRTPDRLTQEEINKWMPDLVYRNCYDYIRHIVSVTNPDLIVITGDMVYGEFDDSGRINKQFYEFMDSFNIPWAPCFGNHDNETAIGVDKQCDMLESLPNCLFKRGNVTGFGNYSVGICHNGQPIRAIYLLDSHGCGLGFDEKTRIYPQLAKDQLEMVANTSEMVEKIYGKRIPGILAYHIPDSTFADAANEKGYKGIGEIGKDFTAQDGDCGKYFEYYSTYRVSDGYLDLLVNCNIDAILTGHWHKINASVLYKGIRYVFGTKTGLYDYHSDSMLGGTMIDTKNSPPTVEHYYYPIL